MSKSFQHAELDGNKQERKWQDNNGSKTLFNDTVYEDCNYELKTHKKCLKFLPYTFMQSSCVHLRLSAKYH